MPLARITTNLRNARRRLHNEGLQLRIASLRFCLDVLRDVKETDERSRLQHALMDCIDDARVPETRSSDSEPADLDAIKQAYYDLRESLRDVRSDAYVCSESERHLDTLNPVINEWWQAVREALEPVEECIESLLEYEDEEEEAHDRWRADVRALIRYIVQCLNLCRECRDLLSSARGPDGRRSVTFNQDSNGEYWRDWLTRKKTQLEDTMGRLEGSAEGSEPL